MVRDNEWYRKKAMIIVGGWKTGDTVSQLEVLANNSCTGLWLSDFASTAKGFYKTHEFQDLINKVNTLDTDTERDVYRLLSSEHLLTMESLFYSHFPRGDRTEPRMHLKLEKDEPTIIKVKPKDQIVPLEYFAARFQGYVEDWLETWYGPKMLDHGTPEKSRALDGLLSSEDYRLFAKAMHYSLPVHAKEYAKDGVISFKLEESKEGFAFLFS